jgi:hypothetical protein
MSSSMSAGQQLGIDMATNFMLMTLFSIIAEMGNDPHDFRTNVRKALCDLTENYDLPGIAPEMAKEARKSAKQIIAGVLQDDPRSSVHQ